jgi:regulator of sigma E protease
MDGVLGSVLAFVVAIALLVAIHEFGHFWVARKLGFKVLRFSIGFGNPLWLHRGRDGVEYVVAAIPLGGFVRMLDEREGPVAPEHLARAYNRQAVWKRALVLVAGPAANLLAAVLIYWVMLLVGMPGVRPLVGVVTPDSPAAVAGLRAQDEFVMVGGRATPTWESTALALLDTVLAGETRVEVELRDEHGNPRRALLALDDPRGLTEPGALLERLGLQPWSPTLEPILGEVDADGAAARAGLRSGDRIETVDGAAVADWRGLVAQVQARPDQRLRFGVLRDGEQLELEVRVGSADLEGRAIGRIGVRPFVPEGLFDRLRSVQRFGPLEAVPEAFERTVDLSVLTLRMLWRMLTGDASLSNISGPINIAQYAGVTAAIGVVAFLGFLAVISVSLGVLNLLPIPVLDGGQLVFLAAEQVTGRPISPAVEAVGQQLGVLLLVALMGLAFYNDIARLLA